jgi:hypothetical protein
LPYSSSGQPYQVGSLYAFRQLISGWLLAYIKNLVLHQKSSDSFSRHFYEYFSINSLNTTLRTTAKPLEPVTAPGCDNGPIEGLLPASPLWFKTVRERLHSYGSYRVVILLSYQEFIYLSEFGRDNDHAQKLLFQFFYHLNLIRDANSITSFCVKNSLQ